MFELRPFEPADVDDVARLASTAFAEFADHGGWPSLPEYADKVLELARTGEMIVATVGGRIAGCVTYVGCGAPKPDWFDRSWAVIRMLVVLPDHRGLGIGRALAEECVKRARRDGAPLIALHTSPTMRVAFAMYERMGFTFVKESPPRGDAPYGVYAKRLASDV